MPHEIRRLVRALISAACITLSIAYWQREPHDKFYSDLAFTLCLCWIGQIFMVTTKHWKENHQ